jgi:hypothetical protein
LQVPAKKVSAIALFEASGANPDLLPVKKYFINDQSLFGSNAHMEVENLRNSLVHYCDLASQGFIAKYFHDARTHPVLGQFESMQLVVTFLAFDLTTLFSLFYPIFSLWLSNIPADTASMIQVHKPAKINDSTLLTFAIDEARCLHLHF